MLSVWLIAQSLCLATFAAEPQRRMESDQELGEVLVDGRKPEKDPQKVIEWMARLVGEFTFEGAVELAANGKPRDQQAVDGSGKCIGFGPAPAVQCEINVHWTPARLEDRDVVVGGASSFEPAMMLFGFEPDRVGIRHMLVDSKGIAESALGYLIGDTLVSRSPCANVPGPCERVVHIIASRDPKTIDMRIDLEVGNERMVSFDFVMRRVPGSKSFVESGPGAVAGRK